MLSVRAPHITQFPRFAQCVWNEQQKGVHSVCGMTNGRVF